MCLRAHGFQGSIIDELLTSTGARMREYRRISRIVEHWTLPTAAQVVDHVRRARIQLVQVGNFGVDFYSLVGDENIVPSWSGMPLPSAQANLDLAAEVIPQIQEAGANVTGTTTRYTKQVPQLVEAWLTPGPFELQSLVDKVRGSKVRLQTGGQPYLFI